jgi:hypothetical protein
MSRERDEDREQHENDEDDDANMGYQHSEDEKNRRTVLFRKNMFNEEKKVVRRKQNVCCVIPVSEREDLLTVKCNRHVIHHLHALPLCSFFTFSVTKTHSKVMGLRRSSLGDKDHNEKKSDR